MNKVLTLKDDGSWVELDLDHEAIRVFFGGDDFHFCGNLEDLNVVAVSRKTARPFDSLNPYSSKKTEYFDTVYGDILLIGSDQNGRSCDVNVASILSFFQE